ncbi:sodium channel protein Nach-like [Aricia agestis]|uniref:sodium channel protein Nach-like n=1 Tax=Aricia agestis TaxID=91739 RepID=UPI001C20192A|nr:sodium channel protein Nach-like [Aricia agestis]
MRETTNIFKILSSYNRSQQEISQFFAGLPALRFFTLRQDVASLTDMLNILKRHYYSVDTIMEEVHQPCERLLLYCSFNRKRKRCVDVFSLIKTYEGHCCTFNYAALNDDRDFLLTDNSDIEFYVDPSAEYEQTNIISTSQSGRGSGLSVVFDVEPEDYPPWSPLFSYGAKILLSDPNDYPETTVLYKYALPGKSLDIKVEPRIFQCDDEIRRVPAAKRGCWFHDEVLLEHTNRYSFETCNTECKMQQYEDTCGCIPYKYPSEKLYPVCEFKDLECLSDFRAYGVGNASVCSPPCFMECRDKKYSVTSDVMPLVTDLYPGNVT